MLSSTVYKVGGGGPMVDKNGHFIATKMPIFNNFGNSSQHLEFDAEQKFHCWLISTTPPYPTVLLTFPCSCFE